MSIRVALQHRTTYQYDRPVTLSPQVIRLRPAPHSRTPISSYALVVEPAGHFLNWQQDPFGNFLARAVFQTPTSHLHVQVDLIADLEVLNPFNFFIDPAAEDWPFAYEPQLAKDLAPYREGAAVGPRLHAFLAGVRSERACTIDFLVELNRLAHASIGYVIRMDPGVQSPEETLEKALGLVP